MAEAKHPYRESDAPLARYVLRTSWSALVIRAVLGVVGLSIALSLAVLTFQGIIIGMVGWVVCLAAAIFGIAMLVGLSRFKVQNGAELRVYRTHVDVPMAFAPPREMPVRDLEVEVRSRNGFQDVVVEGKPMRIPNTIPIDLTLTSPSHRRVLSALLFETPIHAARLASDVRRLREGKELVDHEHPDLEEMMGDFQRIFGDLFQQQAAPKRDEEDERLDEELRKLDR